jgi:hypothetical protein
MSRILKVSGGDYRLQVQSGGNIILDTGSGAGTVTITGNLDVKGTTTTVESINTTIQDNILQLNYDPNIPYNGAGISGALGYESGLSIWRGSLPTADFVFSEQVSHYDSSLTSQAKPLGTDVPGTFILRTKTAQGSAALSSLMVRSITNDGLSDLVFDLKNQPIVLRIANAADIGQPGTAYASRLTDPNDVPNLQFIYQYIASTWSPGNPSTQGTALVNSIQFPAVTGASIQSNIVATATALEMRISQQKKVTVDASGLNVGEVLYFSGHEISDRSGNANLVLHAYNNHVEINSVLDLDDQPDTPAISAVSGATRLYSKSSPGVGKSAMYFTNIGAAQSTDELMSRRKAVVLSILL